MTVSELRTLVDNLDEYIHIPGGIDRLKKMILHLAVSGQLVPQDPSEGTGEALYEQIKSEYPAKKVILEISEEDKPFNIPSNWKWVRLPEIYRSQPPVTKLKTADYLKSGKYPIVDQGQRYIAGYTNSGEPNRVSVPVTIFGDHTREIKLIDFDFIVGADGVKILEPILVDSQFFYTLIDVFRPQSRGYGRHFKMLNDKIVPLPPLAEQKRIVAKVDSIFALIDQLAEVYKSEQTERSKLVTSSLAQLAKAENDVEDSLALTHLSEIIRTKADAKILRQTILHLAVSGQLVPQDTSEGIGEDLYKQIQAEKAELTRQGKIKKQKTLPEISEDEVPFAIPSSWKWTRLGESYDVRDGTHDTPKYIPTGYPLITSKNLSTGKLDFSNVKYISQSDYMAINERSDVKRNDILFAMIGSIGNPVAVDTDTEFSIKNVALFKPYNKKAYSKDWLLSYLFIASEDMKSRSLGAVQSFVSLGFLRNYPIPLPPLAEQKRIVTKTAQLLDLVSELEKHLEK